MVRPALTTSSRAIMCDLRHAVRALTRDRHHLGISVVVVALSVTAVVALFSVYTTLIIDAVPFPDSEELVAVRYTFDGTDRAVGALSMPAVQTLLVGPSPIKHVAYFLSPEPTFVDIGKQSRPVLAVRVSASFFSTLGLSPLHGRWFAAADHRPGVDRVAIISSHFWLQTFGADPNIIGRDLVVNQDHYEVVGVMPPTFDFPSEHVSLWLPHDVTSKAKADHRSHSYATIARVAPGTRKDAVATLSAVASALKTEMPEIYGNGSFRLSPVRDELIGPVGTMSWIAWGAMACVLLAAAANLTNLTLVRLVSRENTIRTLVALGATRSRLSRLIFCEAGVIAAAGAGVGMVGGWGLLELVVPMGTGSIPKLEEVSLDLRVVSAAVLAAALATCTPALVFVIRPYEPRASSRPRERSVVLSKRASRRMQHLLCALQIGVAASLSMGAALLVSTLFNIQSVSLGFSPRGLNSLQVVPSGSTVRDGELLRRLAERLRDIPGISGVALTDNPLLSGMGVYRSVRVQSLAGAWGYSPLVLSRSIDGDYFRVLQIAALNGRTTLDDRRGSPCVAVVNQAAARMFWPGVPVVGRRFDLDASRARPEICTVVGVVADARTFAVKTAAEPELYFAAQQWGTPTPTVLIRADVDNAPASGLIQQIAISVTGPNGASLWPVENTVRQTWQEPRFRGVSLALLAGGTLSLACLGVYGVTAHIVRERRREFAIRMALGATSKDIRRAVLRQSATTVIVGLALGAMIGAGSSHLLESSLYGVSPIEWPLWIGVLLCVGCVALAATYIPMVRSTQIETRTLLSRVD